jgi:hypothetical protein
MKAVCIVVKDNKISEQGYNRLVESSKQVNNDFEILNYDRRIIIDYSYYLFEFIVSGYFVITPGSCLGDSCLTCCGGFLYLAVNSPAAQFKNT